jgi:hypothetical protein
MSNEWAIKIISMFIPALVGAAGIAFRMLIVWMRAQKNVALHTLGELAFNEVQNNFIGVAGEQKMKIAIEKVRARLVGTSWAKNVSDEEIIKALQKAWYNQEGQYKSVSPSLQRVVTESLIITDVQSPSAGTGNLNLDTNITSGDPPCTNPSGTFSGTSVTVTDFTKQGTTLSTDKE